MSQRKPAFKFAVCIENEDYEASLELHKIYRVLIDKDAEVDGDIRVIDESGVFRGLPLTISAGYSIRKDFATQYSTWEGSIQAKPVTATVVE